MKRWKEIARQIKICYAFKVADAVLNAKGEVTAIVNVYGAETT